MMFNALVTVGIFAFGVFHSADAKTRSGGCGRDLPAGTTQGGAGQSNLIKIQSNGIQRSFLLHVPTVYDKNKSRGLIFSFHGRTKNGGQQEDLTGFSDPAINKDMIVAYPHGIDHEWQGDPDAKTDDIKFTLDMIDYIANNYCVNMDKIYASGKSNGGGFAVNQLPCDARTSKRIAAFAGASPACYQAPSPKGLCDPNTVPIPCSASRKNIPILEFHGSADTTIPFYGGTRRGKCLPAITHFIQAWAARDGLNANSNVTTLLYNNNVHKHTFGNGLVQSFWVNQMGHDWPSTKSNDDSSTPTFLDASPLIIDFFNQFPLTL